MRNSQGRRAPLGAHVLWRNRLVSTLFRSNACCTARCRGRRFGSYSIIPNSVFGSSASDSHSFESEANRKLAHNNRTELDSHTNWNYASARKPGLFDKPDYSNCFRKVANCDCRSEIWLRSSAISATRASMRSFDEGAATSWSRAAVACAGAEGATGGAAPSRCA
jgi:hypothetical protein